MSFIAQEQGIATGSPIELYDFSYDFHTWSYTSGDASFYDAATTRSYEPIVLDRGALKASSDITKNDLDLEIQFDAAFLDLFRAGPPSGVVSVTIRRLHRTDVSSEIVSLWKGRIVNVTWGVATARVTCESIRSSAQRFGLRRMFQRQCPHVLYSNACGASKALYEMIGTVESISGTSINITGVSSKPVNYFAGGYLQYTDSILGTNERRAITGNPGSTNQINLIVPTINLSIGDEVRVYPGCDHTLGSNGCVKFNNTINFGGKPYTPTKNPFGGEPIY